MIICLSRWDWGGWDARGFMYLYAGLNSNSNLDKSVISCLVYSVRELIELTSCLVLNKITGHMWQ